jgi:ferredoxin--NADP+ reductase
MESDKSTAETITEIRRWTPKLFSLRITRAAAFRFRAGQFARLGVMDDHGAMVWRAYSMVSAPHDDFLEFFSIVVPGGAFTSRLSRLQVGDTLHVDKTAFGYLTLDRFVGGRDLWLLATGTGIAPFMSILDDLAVWTHFERIVLVYSVREVAELAYLDKIQQWLAPGPRADSERTASLIWLPVVTREAMPGALTRRITDLLPSGELEAAAGFVIDPERARLMLCGNPQMVLDTRKILQARGLTLSRLAVPGHYAVEQFW